jgi:hypothetical protein
MSNIEIVRPLGTGIFRPPGGSQVDETILVNSHGFSLATGIVEGEMGDLRANEPEGYQQLTLRTWENHTGAGWGYSGDSSTGALSRVTTDVTSPADDDFVLEGFYPEDATNGFGAGRTFHTLNNTTEFYAQFLTRVDADFINHPFQLKWHFVQSSGGDDAWIDWRHRFEENMGDPANYEESNLRFRFQGLAWEIDQLQEQNVQPELVVFPRGVWVNLEMYMQDGRARLWQDGVLICDISGFTLPGGSWTQFHHEGVYGGAGFPVPQDQSWWVAETYISLPE